MSQRVVFLDRDGVLNRAFPEGGTTRPPMSVAELELLPGVPEALARLRAAGFVLVVVTNQPDVARGKQTRAAVEEINAKVAAELQVPVGAALLRSCHGGSSLDRRFACACRLQHGSWCGAGHQLRCQLHGEHDQRRSLLSAKVT